MKGPQNHDSPFRRARSNKRVSLAQTALLCALSLAGVQQGLADEEPPPARQQPEPHSPSKAQMKAGQTFFNRGQQLFQEGKYEAAWLEFSAAYEIAPNPDLILNIAECKVKMNRPKEALTHYREFLRLRPDSLEGARVRGEVARLEAEVNGPPPAPSSPSRRFPVVGSVLAGSTLLFVVFGGAAVGVGMSRFNELSTTCKPLCSDEQVQNVRTPLNAGYAMFGLAAVTAVAAAIALPLELKVFNKAKEKDKGANVALGLGLGTLTFAGRF